MTIATLIETVGAAVLAAGGYTFFRLFRLGAMHQPENKFIGGGKIITSVKGPEAMTLDEVTGRVFITSQDRRAQKAGINVRGKLYMLDLEKNKPSPVMLNIRKPKKFHPHGVSIFREEADVSLFVINHRSETNHTVEVFDVREQGVLEHRRTIRSDVLQSPNDIVAVGRNNFYFTNDGRSRMQLHRSIDTFLYRGTGSIGYFNGETASVVVPHLHFANGITVNQCYTHLYVSETTTGMLSVYEIGSHAAELTIKGQKKVGAGLDNMSFDDQGNLWIARHPNLLAFARHRSDANYRSPSEVIRVHLPSGVRFGSVQKMYASDGTQISGSSVALTYGHQLLIGSAFESTLMIFPKPD